jgi:hypothetical protein
LQISICRSAGALEKMGFGSGSTLTPAAVPPTGDGVPVRTPTPIELKASGVELGNIYPDPIKRSSRGARTRA